MSRRRGRPAALRDPAEFGTELTFAELGRCLGMSRYRAKILVVDNGVPTISHGALRMTVHREVAKQIVNGEWWTMKMQAQA